MDNHFATPGFTGPLENLRYEAARAMLPVTQLERALIRHGIPIVYLAGGKFAARHELDRFWRDLWVQAGGDPVFIPPPNGLTRQQHELLQALNPSKLSEAPPPKPNGDTAPSSPEKRNRKRKSKPTGEER